MVENHQHLFIDFEFTMPERGRRNKGFYPEIIEAGIVAVANGQIYEKYSTYVTPIRFPILSDRCKSFLHLRQEQIDHGITFHELINKFTSLTKDFQNTVVTWGNMDMKVLRQNCEQAAFCFHLKQKKLIYPWNISVFLGIKIKQAFGKRFKSMERMESANIIVH